MEIGKVYAALHQARIEAARISLPWVDKAGGNTKGRKADDLKELMLDVCKSCNIAIIPGEVTIGDRIAEKTKSGGNMYHCMVSQEFLVVSTEDGSCIKGGSAASGMDTGDKYISKALTYAKKSFLLNLLDIPTEPLELEEVEEPEDSPIEASQVQVIKDLLALREEEFSVNPELFMSFIKDKFGFSSLEEISDGAKYEFFIKSLLAPPKGKEWSEGVDLQQYKS